MPIIPGYPGSSLTPEKLWSNFERGILTEVEIVSAFLDYLGDDVEEEVASLPIEFREMVARFLRSKPISEIREGMLIGRGLSSDDRVRWQQYRQSKAATVAEYLGVRNEQGVRE